ncbi:MAG: 23S rRNA (pseudouridine(1915)-N(3))-methyltransferase RlmH [Rhodospirillales bacterium]|jgi:23S rRNA (pseudouridine1915-N3)-methyltransferase|nr:23S rRNA (pseudouridine(1915)-N(3))-methyltransferase RlmH [Rhodospirillales bacterium]HIJ43701.1 23S rRNA (pseudouridine(1915)-N(3))-methyltransferase RlmH [Rhodospirillaceae bacterium]MDP7097977.1 23S rRNA (pseudouridine(1915)-N(3))-methyltransferase RlmH [Rhodospirillales bacterium]MDP7216437.1 23S rRNA (pseudouridine(1915)-N(3))-methyltransferase RlmH [Rhodospirillales bacterium]HIJ44973.1 23S rRNA (pseudouridine(1915)-N(3))-methyltransferase RlmH [Rhodospirillaceae bacterium]
MRILIAAVGRLKAGPERALFEHYAGRVTFPFCLKEVEEKRRLPVGKLRKREAELLLGAAPQGAVIVALDERGQALSSAALADRIGTWRDDGRRDLVFLIGGPQGLDESMKAGADLVLSLGPMTWPHLLVRGLVAEQIYRAQCILSGHPYHRR